MMRFRLIAVLALLLFQSGLGHAGAGKPPEEGVFATVDGQAISGEEYRAVLMGRSRQKFYHGKPPESVLADFRREVGNDLVDERLLEREAKRRGLPVDEQEVARQLARVENRLAGSPQWEQQRERLRATLTERIRRELRVAALRKRVQESQRPTAAAVQTYYDRHPDKFTTPEQLGVSVILLRVPANAQQPEWDEARRSAERIYDELRDGAEFAAKARLHSKDASAGQGGDLGYLHREMLGEGAQDVVERLQVGEFSAPVLLLDGYALFRLNGRRPARLNSFGAVRERAAALWLREAQQQAWHDLVASLRGKALIQINEQYFAPTAEESPARRVQQGATP